MTRADDSAAVAARERDKLRRAAELRRESWALMAAGDNRAAARMRQTADQIETRVMSARNRRIDARAAR